MSTEGEDVYSGEFWLAGSGNRVGGLLRLVDGQAPRLQLNGSLTPMFEVADTGGDAASGYWKSFGAAPSGPAAEKLIVHGELAKSPSVVTLVDCFTQSRRQQLFGSASEQTLEAKYAILGGLLSREELSFDALRLRFTNLDAWASLSGFGMTRRFDGSGSTISYTEPEPPTAGLLGGGAVRLTSVMHAPWRVDPQKMTIERRAWLEVDPAKSVDWKQIDRLFVRPLKSFLQLCTLRLCELTAVEVERDGTSYTLVPGRVWRSASSRGDEFPLPLGHIEFDCVAEWLDCVGDLSPASSVVSDRIVERATTLETTLLELTTVAEGLHRAAFVQSNRLEKDVASRVRSAIASAVQGEESRVRAIVAGRMSYVEEMSYPKRLAELASEAEVALPGVTGKTKKWIELVSESRNTFAHGKKSVADLPDIDKLMVAVDSLRWVLASILLLNSGISPLTIQSHLAADQRYRSFLASAASMTPVVYSAT